MKKTLLSALCVAAAVSCAQTQELKEEQESPSSEKITIVATLSDQTRTLLGGNKVYWEAGDQIHFCLPGYSNNYVFDIEPADVGKTTARFYYQESGRYIRWSGITDMAAVYPASIYTGHTSSSFYVKIPAVQSYRENSFGKGANVAVAKTTDTSQPYVFYNTGGILKLTVKGTVTVSKIELKTEGKDEYLAGDAYIDYDMSGEQSAEKFILSSSLSKKLTLDCGDGVPLTNEGVDFFFYVPYGTLAEGFSVTVFDTAGGSMTKEASANEANSVHRSEIKAMPAFSYSSSSDAKFKQKVIPGIYDQCLSEPVMETAFLSSKLQSGVTTDDATQVFSVKNWSDEWVVEYSFPYGLTKGESYTVSVSPVLGNSGVSAQTLNLKFLVSDSGLAWFVDESTEKGYIFNVIE